MLCLFLFLFLFLLQFLLFFIDLVVAAAACYCCWWWWWRWQWWWSCCCCATAFYLYWLVCVFVRACLRIPFEIGVKANQLLESHSYLGPLLGHQPFGYFSAPPCQAASLTAGAWAPRFVWALWGFGLAPASSAARCDREGDPENGTGVHCSWPNTCFLLGRSRDLLRVEPVLLQLPLCCLGITKHRMLGLGECTYWPGQRMTNSHELLGKESWP